MLRTIQRSMFNLLLQFADENHNLRKSFFEANVRDYQGHNSVNSSIADTLEGSGTEDFWWLNNGITILSTDIKLITNKSLQVVNPEIVNGLQTSREIYNYFSDKLEKIDEDKRTILVRAIKPESEESRDNIIFSTNNQTSIPKSSLRVTDTIHLQIEMYFKNRGLYYDRRKNYYKNQKKKASDIISVSFLAQCLISLVLRKPDFARARPSTLLTDEETYKFLYEENQELEAYYKAAKIGRIIQSALKSNESMSNAEVNDILFYVIYATVADKMKKKELTFSDIKELDQESITNEEVLSVANRIYEKYKDKGFEIVGVAREFKNTERMKQAIAQDKYPWLQLVELDDGQKLWTRYMLGNAGGGVFLVDRDGTILAVNPKPEEVQKVLEQKLGE